MMRRCRVDFCRRARRGRAPTGLSAWCIRRRREASNGPATRRLAEFQAGGNLLKRKGPLFFAPTVFACAILSCTLVFAQLGEPPNDFGLRLGHIHLTVKDVEAHRRFWTEMLGGTLVKNGPLTLIQFPGVFVMLREG